MKTLEYLALFSSVLNKCLPTTYYPLSLRLGEPPTPGCPILNGRGGVGDIKESFLYAFEIKGPKKLTIFDFLNSILITQLWRPFTRLVYQLPDDAAEHLMS